MRELRLERSYYPYGWSSNACWWCRWCEIFTYLELGFPYEKSLFNIIKYIEIHSGEMIERKICENKKIKK